MPQCQDLRNGRNSGEKAEQGDKEKSSERRNSHRALREGTSLVHFFNFALPTLSVIHSSDKISHKTKKKVAVNLLIMELKQNEHVSSLLFSTEAPDCRAHTLPIVEIFLTSYKKIYSSQGLKVLKETLILLSLATKGVWFSDCQGSGQSPSSFLLIIFTVLKVEPSIGLIPGCNYPKEVVGANIYSSQLAWLSKMGKSIPWFPSNRPHYFFTGALISGQLLKQSPLENDQPKFKCIFQHISCFSPVKGNEIYTISTGTDPLTNPQNKEMR